MKLIFVISTLSAIHCVQAVDYIAAVVNFEATPAATQEQLESNVNMYQHRVTDAKGEKADIIVFPEYGLTGGIVEDLEPVSIVVPEVNSQEYYKDICLEKLSNSAKENQIYIVINLFEKEGNVTGKIRYYNTNIVFGKDGAIIAKYRATNTGNVRGITAGAADQLPPIFHTSFNVKFGIIGSNDMNTKKSAVSWLKNVTDVILTTSRTSYLPFQHTLSTQIGYAMANRVNLLAASLNNPEEGIGGSGIFGADGTIYSAFITGSHNTKVLIGSVSSYHIEDVTPVKKHFTLQGSRPQPDGEQLISKFSAVRQFNHKQYKSLLLNLTERNIKTLVCHGSFCCNYQVNVAEGTNTSDYYQLLAFSGVDQLGEKQKERIKLCALVACESADLSSCGTRNVAASARFDSISVETNAANTSYQVIRPLLLRKDLLPVLNTTFSWNNILTTKEPQSGVVVFGILASGANSLGFSVLLIVAVSSVIALFH